MMPHLEVSDGQSTYSIDNRPDMTNSVNIYRFLIRRAFQSILLIFVLVVANFILIHLAPGHPVPLLADQSGDAKYCEFIRATFGLDQSLGFQLWVYLKSSVQGDLGYSLSYQQPVSAVILSRVPATLLLMLSALLVSSSAGMLLGVESARRSHSFTDRLITLLAVVFYSAPAFCTGQILLIIFSLYLRVFPAQGMTSAGRSLSGTALCLVVLTPLILPLLTPAPVHPPLILPLTP